MPRSKKDYYKRACAQAVSHMAAAIMRVNQLHELMVGQHDEELDELKTIMAGLVACREHTLKKAEQWWLLDEDGLRTYQM